jgi:hypothetical protein
MSATRLVTEVRTITPNQAKEILETKNDGNRNVRKARVERWAREMKAGNWKLTGEPIIFGKTGRLLNGQHRLHAVIESNVPLTTVVIAGVDESTFNVMDSGMARSMGDVFRSHGIKSGNQQASNTKQVMQYLDGVPLSNHKHMEQYTRDDLVAYFEKHQAAFEFADSRGCSLRSIGLPRGVAGVVSYILYSVDYEGADYFISRLQSGAGLRPTSPILALRNYIIRTFSSKQRPTDVMDWMVPTIIRAYNDWATGTRRQRVSVWKSGDALPMPVKADKRVASISK